MAAAAGLLVALTPAPSPSPPPLTEARITAVTCSGIMVTQTGLPPSDQFEVVVTDSGTTVRRELARLTATSDPAGVLLLRVPFNPGTATRLHVEVEGLGTEQEYGETGVLVSPPCVRSQTGRPALWLALAAVVAAGGALLLRHRRRGRHV